MDTLFYILNKYNLDPNNPSPIEIPNVGRNDLAFLFAELGFTMGAEIGVQEGLYSETLCKANPDLKLYSIDPYRVYKGYRDHTDQDEMDILYRQAFERLKPYRCVLLLKTSMDALEDIPDESLDFVYIDGNHEIPWVLDDICWWMKKVKQGGIISGHDYFQSTRHDTKMHVVYAVNCVVQAYRINPWFLLGRRRAPEGEVRDDPRSWFWVKP